MPSTPQKSGWCLRSRTRVSAGSNSSKRGIAEVRRAATTARRIARTCGDHVIVVRDGTLQGTKRDQGRVANSQLNYPITDYPITRFFRPAAWVGGPLRPRAGVQLRAREAGVLEGEQVVAGGDSRSAVADDVIGGDVADRGADLRAQFFRRPEQSLLVQVPLEEMILRARNVTADLVDRFGVAAVSLRRARVDEARRRRRRAATRPSARRPPSRHAAIR